MIDKRWYGWPQHVEVESQIVSEGPWVDLSHTLRSGMARVASLPAPTFERFMSMPEQPMNITRISMATHIGTHVDAPSHFISGGPSINEVGLERLTGRGVVIAVRVAPHGHIDLVHLESAKPAISPGDIVIISTGFGEHFGSAAYDDHPCLTLEAANWLVGNRVKLVALDTPTPDLAANRRSEDFDWPIHHELLGHGVLIAEHLTGLEILEGARVEAMFLPLSIDSADGGPARVVARRVGN